MTSEATHNRATAGHSDDAGGEEKPSYEDINTPVVALVGAISVIVTLMAIMFVQGLYFRWTSSYAAARSIPSANMPANEQISAQKALLEGSEGTISIEKSMEAVVKKYGK